MKELFENQYLILAMTFAIFYYFRRLQYRTGWLLLNPILIAIVVLIAYLKLTGVSFETFEESSSLIDFWLKPAVVALGVPLYLQFEAIKKLWLPIVLSQLVGCLVGIVSVVLIAQFFGASQVGYLIFGEQVGNNAYRNGGNADVGRHPFAHCGSSGDNRNTGCYYGL